MFNYQYLNIYIYVHVHLHMENPHAAPFPERSISSQRSMMWVERLSNQMFAWKKPWKTQMFDMFV